MASPIKTVALCSPTGKLGPNLLEALTSEGFSVTVIVRASSKATFATNQKITKVSDEYSEDELTSAFRGHDAVVLSLPFELLPQSKKFADASIAAGTRWLIASTYGPNLEDPNFALFPASGPHRQAIDELTELQTGREDTWAWTAISCGPWPETAVAAGAWNISAPTKTAELVDGGHKPFTTSTREQTSLAVARVLKRQPASARNKNIYVASFEVNMLAWLDAYKQVVGAEGWNVNSVAGSTKIKQAQAQLANGDFAQGYMGMALVLCTGEGYLNQFSSDATLANEDLGLEAPVTGDTEEGRREMVEVVRKGLAMPNPFA